MSDHLTSDHHAHTAPGADAAPPHAASSPPPDVSLLLRAHAERRWLSREVIPVLRQIETCEDLPDEQLPAAAAYLEVIWAEALARARETDAERHRLDERPPAEQPLLLRAHRYHAVVHSLRDAVARRVVPLLAASPSSSRVTARGVR
jgi:hypothetical protein